MKTFADEQCRAELVRRLMTVGPDSARRWGKMSAHQMVCHLSDAFQMMHGTKPVSDATGRLQQTLVKWTALYLPVRWPPDLPTRPEIDQQLGAGTRPGDFAADVAEVRTLMDRITTRQPGLQWPTHPIFGRMSGAAWLRWAYLHTDHHLRQFGA
jgi:hypothetical protein